LIFDIADFDDSTPESTKNLAVDGLMEGTTPLVSSWEQVRMMVPYSS